MSQISIRAQEPEDLPQITELLNQPRAVWGTLQLPYTSLATRQKRFEAAPNTWTPLVAVIEGRVIARPASGGWRTGAATWEPSAWRSTTTSPGRARDRPCWAP